MNPKTAPAFPMRAKWNPNNVLVNDTYCGLSQYAYVAAKVLAADIANVGVGFVSKEQFAIRAFNQADVFFAELANRTKL